MDAQIDEPQLNEKLNDMEIDKKELNEDLRKIEDALLPEKNEEEEQSKMDRFPSPTPVHDDDKDPESETFESSSSDESSSDEDSLFDNEQSDQPDIAVDLESEIASLKDVGYPEKEETEDLHSTNDEPIIPDDDSDGHPEPVDDVQHSSFPSTPNDAEIALASDNESSSSSGSDSSSDSSDYSSDSESSSSGDELNESDMNVFDEDNENAAIKEPIDEEQESPQAAPEVDNQKLEKSEAPKEMPRPDNQIADIEEDLSGSNEERDSDEDENLQDETNHEPDVAPIAKQHVEDHQDIEQDPFKANQSDEPNAFHEEPEENQPNSEEPSEEKPNNEETNSQERINEEPRAEISREEEPSGQHPSVDDSHNEEPSREISREEEPSGQHPSVDDSHNEEPSGEISREEEPSGQHPSVDDSHNEEPCGEISREEEPSGQHPSVDDSHNEEPSDDEQDVYNPPVFEFDDENDSDPANETDDLHGNVRSISSSSTSSANESSSSDNDDDGNDYIDVSQHISDHETENTENGDLAESLKKALEERDRYQQDVGQPMNGYDDSDYRISADIDDASLRARTANDFNNVPIPPVLPPKMSMAPALPPKAKNNKRAASSRRERWSDDEDELLAFPSAHHRKPLHPPPDRVIDFSKTSKTDRKSHDDKHRRHREPPKRVIDVPSRPSEDINDLFKRQAMVSLHSSAYPSHNDAVDPYDTVQDEDEDDLNKLIQEANSLDIRHPKQSKNSVDVVYPSFQRNEPPPERVSLTTSYPDAFAKIAPTNEILVGRSVGVNKPRGISQGHYSEPSTSLPRKRKSLKDNSLQPLQDPLDGDDEVSLAESDFRFTSHPAMHPPPKSMDAQPSYFREVFPSDYTDFESESEFDYKNKSNLPRQNRMNHDVTPYDTVLETDLESPDKENRLNPIVSEDYQICNPVKSNHNTFPKRLKANKPKSKERPGLDVMAVALTDPSTNAVQPMSLPYLGSGPLRRNKSIPAIKTDSGPVSLFGQVPHLVVARDGNRDPLATYNGPKSLPLRKKSKVKAEKMAPKIHLSLSSNQPGGESNLLTNPNNIQINLLPSDDPNVINLNIVPANPPKQEETLVKQSATDPPSEPIPDASPLAPQPILPITAIAHRHDGSVKLPDPSDPGHRVVDIEPVSIQSAPVNPEPMTVAIAEPLSVAIPQSMEPQIAAPQILEPVSQPLLMQQTPIQPAYPIVQQPNSVALPSQLPQRSVSQPPQPIPTQESRVFDHTNTARSQPASVVVEITNPWEDKSRSLPSDRRHQERGMRRDGDSGIDLTNYERKSRRKRRSSSTDDSDYERKKRSSSKRKLKTHMDAESERGLPDEYMEWYKREYLKPSCCHMFLKHFIFVLNLLFVIVGLGLIILGIWGFADLNSYDSGDTMLVLQDPMFPVFIIGIVITLTCLEGTIGFYRDNICMIKFFGWCLVVLCIVFVSGGVAFWVLKDSTITPFVMNNFLDMIKNYNTTSRKMASFTIDQIQLNFKCCGINGYRDWNDLQEFPCREGSCFVPKSCCHSNQVVCSREEGQGQEEIEACKNALPFWVKNNIAILVGLWLVIICLFIVNFISIHFMIREIVYIHQVNKKIQAINDPEPIDGESDSSSDDTSESEYEERRRRRRRRRKRRERKRKNYHKNRAYS